MRRVGGKRLRPEQQLGRMAMEFRSTRDEKKRAEITAEYAQVVSRLIKGGKWRKAPASKICSPMIDCLWPSSNTGPSLCQTERMARIVHATHDPSLVV